MAALAHKIPQTWNHRHVVARVQNQGGHVQLTTVPKAWFWRCWNGRDCNGGGWHSVLVCFRMFQSQKFELPSDEL
jgi:hypothetical protein